MKEILSFVIFIYNKQYNNIGSQTLFITIELLVHFYYCKKFLIFFLHRKHTVLNEIKDYFVTYFYKNVLTLWVVMMLNIFTYIIHITNISILELSMNDNNIQFKENKVLRKIG